MAGTPATRNTMDSQVIGSGVEALPVEALPGAAHAGTRSFMALSVPKSAPLTGRHTVLAWN